MRNSMVSNGADGGGMQDQGRPLYYVNILLDAVPGSRENRKSIYFRPGWWSHQPVLKRQSNDKDPLSIGPKECDNLRQAIRDGSGFIIGIEIPRYHDFQPINIFTDRRVK